LGGIVADLAAVGAGAHGLTVEAGGGGLRVFADRLPHLGAEAVVEPGQQAVPAPLAEVVIDGLPGREVFGQEPPLSAGLDQIEDAVEDFAEGGARAAPFFGGGQEAAKQVPLVVGEICFVSGDFHRPKSATANESRKKSQSNQVFYAFFFFQTGSELRMKSVLCQQGQNGFKLRGHLRMLAGKPATGADESRRGQKQPFQAKRRLTIWAGVAGRMRPSLNSRRAD